MKKWMKITLDVVGLIILLLVIDLGCVFTIYRPLFAIKKDNGSVYRGIFYDSYDCAEFSVPQIKTKGTKFSCAIKESQTDVIVLSNVTLVWGAFNENNATLVIKDSTGIPYAYGEWYKIEKKVNGKWFEVKTITNNDSFDDRVYVPDETGEVKFIIDWERRYGKLPSGVYRILKQAHDQYIAFEFIIESKQ